MVANKWLVAVRMGAIVGGAMTNTQNEMKMPAHAGLNADWSSCAWHVGNDGAKEIWLLEDEDSGDYALVSRVWNDAEGCGDVRDIRCGIGLAEAVKLATEGLK